MCAAHQNHRTGNCPECRELETALPPMPLLWSDEGDDQ
jgi:hypothetical protein